jgi:hypothetical protein
VCAGDSPENHPEGRISANLTLIISQHEKHFGEYFSFKKPFYFLFTTVPWLSGTTQTEMTGIKREL